MYWSKYRSPRRSCPYILCDQLGPMWVLRKYVREEFMLFAMSSSFDNSSGLANLQLRWFGQSLVRLAHPRGGRSGANFVGW